MRLSSGVRGDIPIRWVILALDGPIADGIGELAGCFDQLEDLGIVCVRGVVVMLADFGKVFWQPPVSDQPGPGAPVVNIEHLPLSP